MPLFVSGEMSPVSGPIWEMLPGGRAVTTPAAFELGEGPSALTVVLDVSGAEAGKTYVLRGAVHGRPHGGGSI